MADFYSNKRALVTGAGSGIGRSIALALGARGVHVHCADINADAAAAVAGEIPAAQAHTLDVTDASAMAALAAQLFDAGDGIDLLFNNAGIGHAGAFADTELDDWRRVLDVNVMGVVNGIHAFLPRLRAAGRAAHIINTASAAGLFAAPRMGPYCASKHAVVGLSQSLAAELHGSGIGVTILCPGVINTPIIANTQMRGDMATAEQRKRTQAFYSNNGATPDKVAQDLLADVARGRLFCLTPRGEVGVGWLAQRLSPTLAQRLSRMMIARITK